MTVYDNYEKLIDNSLLEIKKNYNYYDGAGMPEKALVFTLMQTAWIIGRGLLAIVKLLEDKGKLQ